MEFQLQHQSIYEYSGLISFRTDWLDLRAVQGTLNSLLQHHSSKASILQHSAFFMVQLSQLYMTTGKTIALTRWTFIGKVMSLLFNGFPGSSAGKESTCNAGDLDPSPGLGSCPGERIGYPFLYSWASLVAQLVKNQLAVQET